MSYRGDPLATASLGLASFVNGVVIRQPCLALRCQCQVHPHARKLHLTPLTLAPVVFNIVNKDGVIALWKGYVGRGVLWAITQVTEVLIADLFALPRTIVMDGSSQRFWRHCWLKSATYLATSPFIISSFIETVRSGARPDDAHLLDVVWRGVERLRFDVYHGGAARDSKRFSVLYLSIPTVGFETVHFIVYRYVYEWIYAMAKRHVNRRLPSDRTRFHTIMPELFSEMSSMAIADLICYPMETILHRLYIQGTRTLVDNLDNGVAAISIGTRYSSLIDCIKCILDKEGVWALFSGIGAIALQYILQFSALLLLRMTLEHIENIGSGSGTGSGSGRSTGYGTRRTNASTNSFRGSIDDTSSGSSFGGSTSVAGGSIEPISPPRGANNANNLTELFVTSVNALPSPSFPTFAQTQARSQQSSDGFGPFGIPRQYSSVMDLNSSNSLPLVGNDRNINTR